MKQTVFSLLENIKQTALFVRFYGLESSGICDLTQHVCETLNIDYYNLSETEEKLFDNELSSLEEYCFNSCTRVIDICNFAINNINETNCYQLYSELKKLKLSDCLLLSSPYEYTKLIIAYDVLFSDNSYINDLEYSLTENMDDKENEGIV